MPVLSQDDLDFFDENGVRLQALSNYLAMRLARRA